MKKATIFLMAVLSALFDSFAQGRNAWWFFGDSAGLYFDGAGNAIPLIDGSLFTAEGCASISDQHGNLLFYTNALNVWNANHEFMDNGDTLSLVSGWMYGNSSTNGVTIIPNPGNAYQYYIFYPSGSLLHGLFYALVDMRLDGGLGSVVIRDSLIYTSWFAESISAVKHANGKDWWLLAFSTETGEYYVFLIDQHGVHPPIVQPLATRSYGNGGEVTFSNQGHLFARVGSRTNFNNGNTRTHIELFDFDRCTGLLSNKRILSKPRQAYYYGCEFSPDDRFLYVSSYDSLFQFDLTAGNIADSRTFIAVNTAYKYIPLAICDTAFFWGGQEIGPDGKIYIASSYAILPNNCYMHWNMHISVINQPNKPGVACDFQPFTVYLGGKRSILSLPNNPNYNLGPVPAYAADAGEDITICKGDTAVLGVDTAYPTVLYVWYNEEGQLIAYGPNPKVSPSSTSSYYLLIADTAATYSCAVREDTVRVFVLPEDSCATGVAAHPSTLDRKVRLLPNPANNVLYIEVNTPTPNGSSARPCCVEATLYNLHGEKVISTRFSTHRHRLDIASLPGGVYLWEVQLNSSVERGKVVIFR